MLFAFAQGPMVLVCVCGHVIACNYVLTGSFGSTLKLHLLTNELPDSQLKGLQAGAAQFCKILFKTTTTTQLSSNVELEGFQKSVKDEPVMYKRHVASDLRQLIRGWQMFPLS